MSSSITQSREEIKNKMLNGTLIEECQHCYDIENHGSTSPRTRFNQQYLSSLNIRTKEELLNIGAPKFYHIVLDNQCNLLCRMCDPGSSSLIKKEYQTLGLFTKEEQNKKDSDPVSDNIFKNIDLTSVTQILITGGEPTINKRLLDSLENLAADNSNHNAEILISTNAVAIPNQLKKICKALPKLKFGVSIDGFDNINHYIRWPSDWGKIIKNIKYFYDSNRLSHFNTTVSIYNISELYQLYKYIDDNFPGIPCFMNFVTVPDHQTPWNYPDKKKVLTEIEKIKNLSLYWTQHDFKTLIDGIKFKLENQNKVDSELLNKFFQFNDILDKSRNIKLKDYIPDIEMYRNNLF
jgi:MoaA/NifB/PqqE/SkfB family radical SAM enzyme